MDLRAREGVDAGLTQIVTDAVVSQVRAHSRGAMVIGSEDLRNLIGFEAEKKKIGCQEMACLAEIGGALGADQLVVGTLAKLGSSYILDLRLIDARRAEVLVDANERLRGEKEEALLDAAAQAVAQLFPGSEPAPAAAPTEMASTPSVPPAATAETANKSEVSHPRPLAWVFGGVGIASSGLAIVGLVETLSFKGWQSQTPGTVVPASAVQSRVNSANTWATVALVSGLAGVACLTTAVITW